MKTIVGLFEEPEYAENAVDTLRNTGFAPASVHVLRSVGAIWQYLGCTPGKILAADFAIGTVLGIALYAFFGVLVAVGQITVGFEQTDAIGALLIFILLGVFVGGMLGAVYGLSDAEQESRLYVRGIRRGGALVVVRTADEHAQRALALLDQAGAQGVQVCRRTSEQPRQRGLPSPRDHLSLWTRRLARGLGLILIALTLLYLIGEGGFGWNIPNLLVMSLTEDFLLLTLLMALVGVVVAWRWEGIGGILIAGSVLLYECINAVIRGHWQFGVLDPLFLLVALLFLWDWWRTVGAEAGSPAATSL